MPEKRVESLRSGLSPKLFRSGGGVWLCSKKACDRCETLRLLNGRPDVTSSRVTPSEGGQVFSAMPVFCALSWSHLREESMGIGASE